MVVAVVGFKWHRRGKAKGTGSGQCPAFEVIIFVFSCETMTVPCPDDEVANDCHELAGVHERLHQLTVQFSSCIEVVDLCHNDPDSRDRHLYDEQTSWAYQRPHHRDLCRRGDGEESGCRKPN